jgi:hypothetical protein
MVVICGFERLAAPAVEKLQGKKKYFATLAQS